MSVEVVIPDMNINYILHNAGQLTIKDLKSVRSSTWEARSKWMDIGIELNVMKSDLEVIQENCGSNVEKCFTEMLTLWLKNVDPPPTWSAMIAALRDPAVGLKKLSDDVSNRFSKRTDSISVTNSIEPKTELSFPYIYKITPDERTRQQLIGRLREESLDIMQEFLVVINRFLDSLEDRDYSVDKLVRYLEDAVKDNPLQLQTMKDIQSFIKRKSSFFNYRLVRYMINMAGTSNDLDQLHSYEKSFLHYAKRRIYECPSTFKTRSSKDEIELQIKLDSEYDQCTLEELDGFQYRLTSVLELNIYCCLLSKVEEGCLEVTFFIPSHLHKTLFPLTSDQEESLMALKVLAIVCGDYQRCFQVN